MKKVAHKSVFSAAKQFFKYHPKELNKYKEQQRRIRQIEKGMLKPF